jgi:hypothetical protein
VPPTDFSFVTPEGWKMMEPDFDKAERKWREKEKRHEIAPGMADKIIRLMWDKYDRWSNGRGKDKDENQTVIQEPKKKEKKASIEHLARIGRTQLIDILNAVTNGTIQNPAVFAQTLEMNKITDPEFFSLFAQDVQRFPQLYPRQLVGYFGELFEDWGYPEMRKVVEQSRGAVGPQPPASYERERPTPSTPPAKTEAPAQPAAPEAPADVKDIAPQPAKYPVEPREWPQGVEPQPSKKGPTYRWYVLYQKPGENQNMASIGDHLNHDDMLRHVHKLQAQGYKFYQIKPVSEVGEISERSAPPPKAGTPAPAAKPEAAPAPGAGMIDTPDPKDPNKYTWLIRYRTKSGHESQIAPVMNGTEARFTMKRFEEIGLQVLEWRKLDIQKSSTVEVDGDVIIRVAQTEGAMPEEKFKAGTAIIFIDDVNLEFEAISARGQIKKNMTGKIKKEDEQDYVVDIAGQLYRVPKIVADAVMDVFKPEVVISDKELGQDDGQKQSPHQQKPQMPAAKPAGQAPGQNQGQQGPALNTDLSNAPRPGAMAAADDWKIVVADTEIMAMPRGNRSIADDFASGATKGKGSNMFIDGDTIYSYGRHFPIATRIDGQFYLTTHTYSVSTARHISEVRNALIRAGIDYILSEQRNDGKVAPPTPEEITRREQETAAEKVKQQKREERRELKRQKELSRSRSQVPEEKAQDIATTEDKNISDEAFIQQHDERGTPIKYRVDRTLAPSTIEEAPSLSKEQWNARIQDMEDQMFRETDPERQEKLRQRIERMRQADTIAWFKTATGEPDQDYDHEFFDKIVQALDNENIPGAKHREFDKYQGVYLTIPSVGKLWIKDSFFSGVREGDPKSTTFTFQKGTERMHMVLTPEAEPDVNIEVVQEADGQVDASEVVEYAISVLLEKMTPEQENQWELGRDRKRKLNVGRLPEQAPTEVEHTDTLPGLSEEQWGARVQDVEDQMLRENDPEKRERLRQKLERMRQASSDDVTIKFAGEGLADGQKADFKDLQKEIHDRTKERFKLDKKEDKLEIKNPHMKSPHIKTPEHQAALSKNQSFADLLMLIEKGAPGVPSEIGKRLYRADGVITRHSN